MKVVKKVRFKGCSVQPTRFLIGFRRVDQIQLTR